MFEEHADQFGFGMLNVLSVVGSSKSVEIIEKKNIETHLLPAMKRDIILGDEIRKFVGEVKKYEEMVVQEQGKSRAGNTMRRDTTVNWNL